MLPAPRVAGAAYVEVAEGDVEAAADGAELFDGFEPFLGLVGEAAVGGDEQVAEGFFVAAPHAAAHLVEVAKAEVLRVVDDHGVGIGDVKAILDKSGGDQHVHIAGEEAHHGFLHLFAIHAAVRHGDAGVGYQTADQAGHLGQVFHPVADEEGLASARHLETDGVADGFLVEGAELGLYGLPVGGCGADDAEVAGPHE